MSRTRINKDRYRPKYKCRCEWCITGKQHRNRKAEPLNDLDGILFDNKTPLKRILGHDPYDEWYEMQQANKEGLYDKYVVNPNFVRKPNPLRDL